MLFNSLVFLVFAGLFFAAWPRLKRRNNLRWGFIVVASFVFYGWWDARFLLLILFSGFIDYFAGLAMARWPKWRKALLGASLVGNIGSLAAFKYLDFAIETVNRLTEWLGAPTDLAPMHLILPVGISFYTFQSMSYTIDVYRGQLQPRANVLHFFAYLSMFPQLVAGPIIRAADLLPQLERAPDASDKQCWDGLRLIIYGYAKKMIVADSLAPVVAAAFHGGAEPLQSGAYWWVVMVFFAVQIYCDFSGYSDIARGLAKWMGYEFAVNFDHPYAATSIRDFWARWHISLSTWFRDYVYVPLGGSRKGAALAHGNMWATMMISGLWHGAAWTFVVWGILHSAYLSVERMTQWPARLARLPGGRLLACVLTFVLVLIAWVFFRAESFSQALAVIGLMFDPGRFNLGEVRAMLHWRDMVLVALVGARTMMFFAGWGEHPARERRAVAYGRWALVVGLIWACVYLRGPGSSFIYFQF